MVVEMDPTIVALTVTPERIALTLKDGRQISAPTRWFPRLAAATPEQLQNFAFDDDRRAVHWPDVDEDIDVSAFLAKTSIVVFPPGNIFPPPSLTNEEVQSR